MLRYFPANLKSIKRFHLARLSTNTGSFNCNRTVNIIATGLEKLSISTNHSLPHGTGNVFPGEQVNAFHPSATNHSTLEILSSSSCDCLLSEASLAEKSAKVELPQGQQEAIINFSGASIKKYGEGDVVIGIAGDENSAMEIDTNGKCKVFVTDFGLFNQLTINTEGHGSAILHNDWWKLSAKCQFLQNKNIITGEQGPVKVNITGSPVWILG